MKHLFKKFDKDFVEEEYEEARTTYEVSSETLKKEII
jgi:hypothetical protein